MFWERFGAAVHSNPNLDKACKLSDLRETVKDSKVTPLLHRATSSSTQYDDLVKMLIERYDQKRVVHQNYSMSLVESSPIKQGSHDELCSFIDTIEHNISSLKDTNQYDIETNMI